MAKTARALDQVTACADVSPRPQIWWLDPELTYGNAKPFVFTQGHSVCNRSFFPCFDTPAVKCTYSAVVKVRIAAGVVSASFGHLLAAGAYSKPADEFWPASLHSSCLPRLGSRLLKVIVLAGQSCREAKVRPYGGQMQGPRYSANEDILDSWVPGPLDPQEPDGGS